MVKFLPSLCTSIELNDVQSQLQKIMEKQNFITTWDPETMLPPHTDVILEANDGRLVHAHKSTLVSTNHKHHSLCYSIPTSNVPTPFLVRHIVLRRLTGNPRHFTLLTSFQQVREVGNLLR